MKHIILTSVLFLATVSVRAQIKNADFESWTNLHQHVYESEMIDSHNVANPLHGDIDYWNYSFDVGISQTTDAYTGSYAAILHNWYNYAQTSLESRDTTSNYPSQLSGHYKYLSNLFTTGTIKVVVVSTIGDTIINSSKNLIPTESWTSFSMDLVPLSNPIDPADSIFITFKNSELSCEGNMMTCNLLFIDNLSLTSSVASVQEENDFSLNMFPNPTDGELTIQYDATLLDGAASLQIYDMTGSVVLNQTIHSTNANFDVSHFQAGTYIVKFSTSDGSVAHRKLMVQ